MLGKTCFNNTCFVLGPLKLYPQKCCSCKVNIFLLWLMIVESIYKGSHVAINLQWSRSLRVTSHDLGPGKIRSTRSGETYECSHPKDGCLPQVTSWDYWITGFFRGSHFWNHLVYRRIYSTIYNICSLYPPGEKENHLQKCLCGGNMLVPRRVIYTSSSRASRWRKFQKKKEL